MLAELSKISGVVVMVDLYAVFFLVAFLTHFLAFCVSCRVNETAKVRGFFFYSTVVNVMVLVAYLCGVLS